MVKRVALGQQVADLGEEGLVGLAVVRLVAAREVPGVDLRLQLGAPFAAAPALRGPNSCTSAESPAQKASGVDAGPGKRLVLEEGRQLGRDAEIAARHVSGSLVRDGRVHGFPPRSTGR